MVSALVHKLSMLSMYRVNNYVRLVGSKDIIAVFRFGQRPCCRNINVLISGHLTDRAQLLAVLGLADRAK